jgi:hypothetical protein
MISKDIISKVIISKVSISTVLLSFKMIVMEKVRSKNASLNSNLHFKFENFENKKFLYKNLNGCQKFYNVASSLNCDTLNVGQFPVKNGHWQGLLTEGEGSVQLTSSYQPVQINCFLKGNMFFFFFYRTRILKKEVNGTESSFQLAFLDIGISRVSFFAVLL